MGKSRKNLGLDEALIYKPILKIASKEAKVAKYDMDDGKYEDIYYIGGKNKKKNNAIFFDSSSGNFHIMPKEAEVLNDCKEAIVKKYSEIAGKLDEKLEKNEAHRDWTRAKRVGKGKIQYKDLFNYIRIKVENERNYDLMFFRMSLDEKAKNVSCILKSIQYEYSRDFQSCSIYPESLEDGCEKKERIENCYYNPCVSFDDDADTIVNDFINFIKEKEENYKSSES